MAVDILGRVIEEASGQRLSVFLDERLFKPLKMVDSGFWVPPSKISRLAQPLPVDPASGLKPSVLDVSAEPKNDSGGAGGVSTAPWTFRGQLKTYQLKILRYPGTFAQLKAFSDLGLYELDPVEVDGKPVVPRHVFHALYEPKVTASLINDVCIIRAHAVGLKGARQTDAVVEVIDYYDPATGFTSMQRTTGWQLSIVASLMAHGETPVGSVPLELAVPGDAFVREARRRGFKVTERVTPA